MLQQNIKQFRKQKGYTQETLAQELNVVRQTVSKWEKGYSVPDALMLEKMADLFEVSVSDLLGTPETTEEKTDLKDIAEQLSILNNQFAKELARKRRNRRIVLLVPMQSAYVPDEETGTVISAELSPALDKAVSEAILSDHSTPGYHGECETESHYVLGTKETGDGITVYLIAEYRWFGFCNGYFTNAGGGNIPVVYTFEETADGYRRIAKEEAEDGSHYTSSIKRLFPARYARKVLRGLSDAENEQMWTHHLRQAQAYLTSIGRTEIICPYSELQIEFLTDRGVSTAANNKLCEMPLDYDLTIGNHEALEDGKRYVYQTAVDEDLGAVTFTKFEYGTNKIVEFMAVDATTGDIMRDAPQPKTVRYFVGKRVPSGEGTQYTTMAVYQ